MCILCHKQFNFSELELYRAAAELIRSEPDEEKLQHIMLKLQELVDEMTEIEPI